MSTLTGRIRLRSHKPRRRDPELLVVQVEESGHDTVLWGAFPEGRNFTRWRDARITDISLTLKGGDGKRGALHKG